jgi:translocation and assembly module TamB
MLLEMDRGPVIQNVRLSPELCDDWIKFVAPLLAGVTRAEGKFSVDLDGAKVPLTEPTKGTVGGVMTIHTAEIGPGPLGQHYLNLAKQVKDIAEGNYAGVGNLLGIGAAPATNPAENPATASNRGVLILPQQQVKFEMIDGRVHHQGLQMTVKDVVITTRGSVGLDQTMELVAEIPIQEAWLKQNKALAGLKGQMLQVPIRGTLTQPLPDLRGIANLTKDLAKNAASGLIQDRASKEINKFFPGLNPGGAAPGAAPAAPGTTPAQPATPSPQDLLNGVKNIFGPK